MITLIKSTFYNEKKTKAELCRMILGSRKLTIGRYCLQFEKKFAAYQGRKHCVLVNSGSSANVALIQALLNMGKLKKGDAVGFSAVTWSTNVMPLIQLGLKPVPVDVELDTLNVSSRTLKTLVKKHGLRCLFLTNLLGFSDDIDTIAAFCRKNKILLVEDNCESLGTQYKGKKLGNFGFASTFSFYVGHHMSTIEGGAVLTDDDDLALMLNMVRAHGWDRNLTMDKQMIMRVKNNVNSTFYSRYTFYDLGYNLRATEIQGFLGILQLRYINSIVKKRERNFLKIAKAVYERSDLYFPIRYKHLDVVSNFAIPIVCRSRKLRDALVVACNGKVEIRPIVGGDMTAQPFFHKYLGASRDSRTVNAQIIHEQGFYVGNNPEMTAREISAIISLFTRFQEV